MQSSPRGGAARGAPLQAIRRPQAQIQGAGGLFRIRIRGARSAESKTSRFKRAGARPKKGAFKASRAVRQGFHERRWTRDCRRPRGGLGNLRKPRDWGDESRGLEGIVG